MCCYETPIAASSLMILKLRYDSIFLSREMCTNLACNLNSFPFLWTTYIMILQSSIFFLILNHPYPNHSIYFSVRYFSRIHYSIIQHWHAGDKFDEAPAHRTPGKKLPCWLPNTTLTRRTPDTTLTHRRQVIDTINNLRLQLWYWPVWFFHSNWDYNSVFDISIWNILH